METEFLVERAKQGDQDALVQLIMAQKQDYYKLAYVYMQNQADAMDAIEDMIIILYESIARLKNAAAFYSWSKTILVNCCKRSLREKRKLLSLDAVREGTDEAALQQKDAQLTIDKYLAELNEKHREVLQLRYYLDLDYQSIAAIMCIPLGTVKSRIANGLKKLKERIGGEGIADN